MSLDTHAAFRWPKWLAFLHREAQSPHLPSDSEIFHEVIANAARKRATKERRTEALAAAVAAKLPGAAPLTAGQVLKAWRRARNLSLVEVELAAELCGAPLGHTTASRIERGDSRTSAEKYRAYLRVLCEWEAKPNA
jgi:hypothetical protein